MRFITASLLMSAALVAPFAALAADAPKIITFEKDNPLPATVSLLPLNGKVGRDNPFYDGYRPQLKFSGERSGITCKIQLPSKDDAVQPGKSADVMLSCLDNVHIIEGQPQFVMYEGGRRVGEGQLTPP